MTRLESTIRNAKLRAVRWLLRSLSKDSNYVKHARCELKDWFACDRDDPDRWMADGTEELLMMLSTQGHSGGSIRFAVKVFERMALFEPWGPLTGKDDEWLEVSDGVFQNKRLSRVFKEDGAAYDSEGRVFEDENGCTYTNIDSHVAITFPYTPNQVFVRVEGTQ